MTKKDVRKEFKPTRMTAIQKSDGYYEDVYYTNGHMSSGVIYLNEKGDFTNAAIQKLGELEDIEEELGIDLVILLKAVKNGVFANIVMGCLLIIALSGSIIGSIIRQAKKECTYAV